MTNETEQALEELRLLLSNYRSTLFNCTDGGWKLIDMATASYSRALDLIERELETEKENE